MDGGGKDEMSTEHRLRVRNVGGIMSRNVPENPGEPKKRRELAARIGKSP